MAIFINKLGSFLATASALTLLPMALAKPAAAYVPASPVTTNLVTNGSFENTPLGYGSWNTFNSIDGWNLSAGSLGSGIEVQNHVAGNPFDGNQFVELDSNAVTGIYQDLSTQVGKTYQLTFAFSPRPGTDEAHNLLNVNWGNQSVASLSANGSGLADTAWKTFTYNLVATSATTRLSFNDFGSVSDSLGTYIDKVGVTGVTAVPEPGSIMGLLAFGAFGAISLRKRQQLQKSTVKA
jgi:hypothetical protein